MGLACIICNSMSHSSLYSFAFGKIKMCKSCGLVFTVDVTENEYVKCEYDSSYFSMGKKNKIRGFEDYFGKEKSIRTETARMFTKVITSVMPSKGRLLDVGCGGGYFVNQAQEHGWQAIGIDISSYAISMAIKTFGNLFICTNLNEYINAQTDCSFEVITLFDVIEHIKNPLQVLSEATNILSKNGILVITTPFFGGRLSSEQGQNYLQFKQDHIFHFNEDTIARLVKKAGFIHVETV